MALWENGYPPVCNTGYAGSSPVSASDSYEREGIMSTASAGAVSVTVINSTYLPLGTTKLKRAMALVLRGDAVIEEFDPLREVRHVGSSFPWPLVIRLLRFVNVQLTERPLPWSKSAVMKRDGWMCGYRSDNLIPDPDKPGDWIDLWAPHRATQVDHILPSSRGGKDTYENTVAACSYHNQTAKRNKLLEDTNMTLVITPHTPTMVSVFGGKKRRPRKK